MFKIAEHTYGNHIFMRMITESGRTEEIDVYLQPDGSEKYVTSADHGMEMDPEAHMKVREEIIRAFNALY